MYFQEILVIIGIVLLFCLLLYITPDNSDKTQSSEHLKDDLSNNDSDKERVIKTLYRQCARWSTASVQDTNPLVANIHANYAAGYLWALEDLYTSNDITAVIGKDHRTFRSEIQKNQDITTRKISSACPNFAKLDGASKLIAEIAGEL